MNKNTQRARKLGYSSMDDLERGTNKIATGVTLDTSWDNPNSKKRQRKVYKKVKDNSDTD